MRVAGPADAGDIPADNLCGRGCRAARTADEPDPGKAVLLAIGDQSVPFDDPRRSGVRHRSGETFDRETVNMSHRSAHFGNRLTRFEPRTDRASRFNPPMRAFYTT